MPDEKPEMDDATPAIDDATITEILRYRIAGYGSNEPGYFIALAATLAVPVLKEIAASLREIADRLAAISTANKL
jgi:hypothetical protein